DLPLSGRGLCGRGAASRREPAGGQLAFRPVVRGGSFLDAVVWGIPRGGTLRPECQKPTSSTISEGLRVLIANEREERLDLITAIVEGRATEGGAGGLCCQTTP